MRSISKRRMLATCHRVPPGHERLSGPLRINPLFRNGKRGFLVSSENRIPIRRRLAVVDLPVCPLAKIMPYRPGARMQFREYERAYSLRNRRHRVV